MHVAIESGHRVRIGGTDTLNTDLALSQTFGFHPSNSPFHLTNVLTTYTRVVPTENCTATMTYDYKVPAQRTYYTGTTQIAAEADCGPGACFNLEFLDSAFNPAGHQRICYDPLCETAAPPTPPSPPPPVAVETAPLCTGYLTQQEAIDACAAYSPTTCSVGTTDITGVAAAVAGLPPSAFRAGAQGASCTDTCAAANGRQCVEYTTTANAPWTALQDTEAEATAVFSALSAFDPCTAYEATTATGDPFQRVGGQDPPAGTNNVCTYVQSSGTAFTSCGNTYAARRRLCWCESPTAYYACVGASPPPPAS